MGSVVTRFLRDLSDAGGCEMSDGPGIMSSPKQSVDQAIILSNHDPRSPSAEILRTPIEVAQAKQRGMVESPVSSLSSVRRSYLETDLDSLTTKELFSKPEDAPSAVHEHNSSVPTGLSSAHLLKLKFLGMDPRSPSSDIIRTPIQVTLSRTDNELHVPKLHLEDSISLGSLSSQDVSRNSASSDFTRECSDPSAFLSEYEDNLSGVVNSSLMEALEGCQVQSERGNCISNMPSKDKMMSDLYDSSAESPAKTFSKLKVFCEESIGSIPSDSRTHRTPDCASAKKNVRNHSRTPLTPLQSNRNITPNSIIRAKQSQVIEKEKLTKVKIYSGAEKNKTPVCLSSYRKEISSLSTPLKTNLNDENAPAPDTRAEWDPDVSIVI